MNKTQIHNLVEQIVAEVVRRVAEENRLAQHPEDVLVLLAGKQTVPEKLLAWLNGRYGEGFCTVFFRQNAPPWVQATDGEPQSQETILARIEAAKTVILAAPEPALLRKISKADDTDDALCAAVVRAILWKKEVRLLLDFEPPQYRRNTFLAGVADALDTLKELRVSVDCYDAGQKKAPACMTLVTEADVRLAAQTPEKHILCALGAIITPSAKDAIAETGVVLQYERRQQYAVSKS